MPIGKVVLTADEIKRERSYAVIRDTNKGRGVFARRDIPAHRRLAIYPGVVYNFNRQKDRAEYGKTTLEYAWEFFVVGHKVKLVRPGANAVFVDDYVREDNIIISPTIPHTTKMYPEFERCIAPRVNEPSPGDVGNVMLVKHLNGTRPTLEYWSSRAIRKNEEITLCYGSRYKRNYTVSAHCPEAGADAFYIYGDSTELRPTEPGELDNIYKQHAMNGILKAHARLAAPAAPGTVPIVQRERRVTRMTAETVASALSKQQLPEVVVALLQRANLKAVLAEWKVHGRVLEDGTFVELVFPPFKIGQACARLDVVVDVRRREYDRIDVVVQFAAGVCVSMRASNGMFANGTVVIELHVAGMSAEQAMPYFVGMQHTILRNWMRALGKPRYEPSSPVANAVLAEYKMCAKHT